VDDDTQVLPRGGKPLEPPPPFTGTQRFRPLRSVGSGGMGEVYEAEDRELGTRCALKVLAVADPAFLLRFKQEFRALRDIVHPNLVRLGELHESEKHFFFTMELLQGTDFIRHVRPEAAMHAPHSATPSSLSPVREPTTAPRVSNPPRAPTSIEPPAGSSGAVVGGFDEHRLRAAFAQLAVGLAALHRAGKVHRDLKPSNVLVEPDGRLVILDFGVVGEIETEHEGEAMIVGTAQYMAPEQARGVKPAPAADWYAAGVVLFQALTGRLPFTTREYYALLTQKTTVEVAPLVLGDHGEVRDLALLAQRLLSRDPAERPGEAEILEAIGLGEGAAWLTSGTLVDPGSAAVLGRDPELELLETASREVREGGALTLVIEGPSGIGKSSLLRAFSTRLSREDSTALVLYARCHEKESVRFKAFDGVVDGLARHLSARSRRGQVFSASGDDLSALCRVFPVLRSVPGFERAARPTDGGTDPSEVRARAFVTLRALLRQVGDSRPVLVGIDDVHWADADSLALLEAILRPPGAPRLLFVLTRRPAPDDALKRLTLGPLRVVTLSGLSEEASRALCAHVAAQAGMAPPSDVHSLFSESAGHPMFLEELLRQRGKPVGAEPGRRRLDDALLSRVDRLPGSAQRLLEAIAISGQPTQHRVAAQVAGLAPQAYAHAVEMLRAERLVRVTGLRRVDSLEPYHDRVREAMQVHVARERALVLHDALASALITHEGDSAEIAGNLELGTEPLRAASYYLRAADEARSALAFERAARLRRRALASGRFAPEDRTALLETTADDLSFAGFAREAGDALLEAAGAPELAEHSRIDLVRRAAELYLSSGHLELGQAAARRALAHCGRSLPTTRLGALLAFLWSDLRIGLSRFSFQKPAGELDPRRALESDVLWSLSVGYALVDSMGAAMLANQSLLHVGSLGDAQRMARCLCVAAAVASGMGRFGRAQRMRNTFDHALDVATDPSIRLYRQISDLAHAFFGDNDWQRALRTAYEARATWSLLGGKRGWEQAQLAQFECWALHQLGDVHALRTRVAETVRDARQTGNRFLEVNFRTFFIDMALADDAPDAALADVLEAIAMWTPVTKEFNNQDYLAVASRTRIALYAGQTDDRTLDTEWDRFERSLLVRVPLLAQDALRLRGSMSLLRARRARDTGDQATVRRELASVKARCRRLTHIPLPLAQLETLPLRAGVAEVEGKSELAVAILRHGLTAFRQRSMALWTACFAHELGRRASGDEGKAASAEARTSFAAHGIRNPCAMLRSCVPGLSELA
jgi:serine/threonine protein kinase